MQSVKIILRDCKRKKKSTLNLSSLDLSFIPEEILCYDFIKELDLSNNNLITLEKSIEKMKNLEVLDLSNNQLIALPMEILQLEKLRILKLQGNNFENDFNFLNDVSEDFEEIKIQLKCLQKKTKTFEDEFLDENEFIFTPKKQKPVQSLVLEQKTTNNNELEILKQQIKDLQIKLEKTNNKNQAIILRPDELQLEQGIQIDDNKFISQGGFSMIYKKLFRGTQVAVKKVFDPKQSQENKDEFLNEVKILNQLRHPYIINMMGYHINSSTNDMQIMFEYVELNLYQVLHQKRLEFDEIQFLLKLCQVYNFMHQSQICHRDIKSLNILVTKNFDPKIIDFGLARKFNELKFGSNSFTATPQYSAPEIFQQKDLTPKVDVYAFGVVMFEILAKEIPYQNCSIDEIKKRVLNGQNLQSSSISSELQTIINDCMEIESKNRPNFEQIQKKLEKINKQNQKQNSF